jgi:hypothetical protein
MLPFSNSKADLGAPSDIGAAAPPPSTADPDAPPASGHVTPEAVHYHDEEQRCDMLRPLRPRKSVLRTQYARFPRGRL